MITHDPENTKKLDIIYAWLSIDENGNEGIIANITMEPDGSKITFPLVTGEEKHVFMMNRIATNASQATDKKIKMFKFKRVTD